MRIALQVAHLTVEVEGEFELKPGMTRALAAFKELAETTVEEKKGAPVGFTIAERSFQDPIQMDGSKPASGGAYGVTR